jgi:hypothetical protein
VREEVDDRKIKVTMWRDNAINSSSYLIVRMDVENAVLLLLEGLGEKLDTYCVLYT